MPQGQAKTTGTTREIIAFPQADEWIPASAGMTKGGVGTNWRQFTPSKPRQGPHHWLVFGPENSTAVLDFIGDDVS